MNTISEQQANVEWSKFASKFDELGLSSHYDMDKLKNEILSSPCSINEDSGTAYRGALVMHINMLMALSQRIAKMISGTFPIDENSLMKVCCIMHLAKRTMYVESENDWDIKRGYPFKFAENEGTLRCGERSALEALNNGVKLSVSEFEAIKALDDDENNGKKAFQNIIVMVVRQANDLAYAIEKERYKKIKNSNNA